MTPKTYYNDIVTPNLLEFKAHRCDYRRGFNAFISAFHMDEHLLQAVSATFTTKYALRAHVKRHCPDFTIVQDVANAYKHFSLSRSQGAVSNVNQVKLTGFMLQENDEQILTENGGAILCEVAELVLTLNDQRTVSAYETVENLVVFWKN